MSVPIATHYADPDDVEGAMRGLHDLEARDRADSAPSEEVGCGRPGDARPRAPADVSAAACSCASRGGSAQRAGCELSVCFVRRAQYLRVRPQLVDAVAEVAGVLGLSNDVVHLALAYLDRLNARTPLAGARLLAALACLVVAAKYSEVSHDDDRQGTVLSYHHVLAALGKPAGITAMHLVAWERRVLQVLDWRLSSATASCFVYAYRAKGIFCADDTAGPERDRPPTPNEQASVCYHTTFFCELATLQGITCAHGASVSAAAAVCAARVVNGIHPSWPPALALRLGNAHAHIDACTRIFLHLFHTQHLDSVMHSEALPPADGADAAAPASASPQGPQEQGASCAEPRTTADCRGAGQETHREAGGVQVPSACADC